MWILFKKGRRRREITATTTTPTMSKKFASSKQLQVWMDDPVNQALYDVLFIDKTSNTVKLLGKELKQDCKHIIATKAFLATKEEVIA